VKKIENQSIFGKDKDKILWLTFLGHPVGLGHGPTNTESAHAHS